MPTGSPIDIHWPAGGLDRRYGFQSQAPYTTASCLNVRNNDPFESRLRGGSRPGLVQILPPKEEVDDEVITTISEFWPAKDTYLWLFQPGTAQDPLNLNTNLVFGHWGGSNVLRTIIHFDLTSILPGATVTAATLRLYRENRNGADLAAPMKVRRILDADEGWVETQATWNNRATATAWSVANDDAPVTVGPYSTTTPPEVDFNAPTVNGHFTIAGLAAMVQYAIDSRAEQLHMMIMAPDESDPSSLVGTVIFIRSSEYTADAERQPKLTVTWTVPA